MNKIILNKLNKLCEENLLSYNPNIKDLTDPYIILYYKDYNFIQFNNTDLFFYEPNICTRETFYADLKEFKIETKISKHSIVYNSKRELKELISQQKAKFDKIEKELKIKLNKEHINEMISVPYSPIKLQFKTCENCGRKFIPYEDLTLYEVFDCPYCNYRHKIEDKEGNNEF